VLCGLDLKATLHGKWHTFLFSIAAAMNPRMVMTVTEGGAPLPVEVRVGAAVETVGAAGKPKTITGFQTHSTPVLLAVKDRAELGDDAYTPLTAVLEGVVVLRVNAEGAARKACEAARDKEEKDRRLRAGGGGRADLTWG
jgi:26S proteasome regulatory subunit N1